jgi:hypothetical protein
MSTSLAAEASGQTFAPRSQIEGAQELALALRDLAQLARELPPSKAQKLSRAFILLAECQPTLMSIDSLPPTPHQIEEPSKSRRDAERLANAERFAFYWRSLQQVTPRERIGIVKARTGWSRSKCYRIQEDAIELMLIP